MSRLLFTSALLALAVAFMPGCKRAQPPVLTPPEPLPPPIVHVAPIPAQPYEEGYTLGYDQGSKDAIPKAKQPTDDEMEQKTQAAAGLDPDHSLKWQRGWAAGYLDGWRSVSQNLK